MLHFGYGCGVVGEIVWLATIEFVPFSHGNLVLSEMPVTPGLPSQTHWDERLEVSANGGF